MVANTHTHTQPVSGSAYRLGTGAADRLHDGVHVEVALIGRCRANAHRLVGHLDVHLNERKKR